MSAKIMRPVTAALVTAALVLSAAPSSAAAHPSTPDASVVTAWNAIAVRTIFTENATPIPSSSLYFGFVSLAVHDAVVAIEGRYQPYIRQPRPHGRASSEAAAATAAYHVLRHYFPASAANLAADHAASLAAIPDGTAEARGVWGRHGRGGQPHQRARGRRPQRGHHVRPDAGAGRVAPDARRVRADGRAVAGLRRAAVAALADPDPAARSGPASARAPTPATSPRSRRTARSTGRRAARSRPRPRCSSTRTR